jgi:hypothetical protein
MPQYKLILILSYFFITYFITLLSKIVAFRLA